MEKRGFISDVSYTSRDKRPGEIDGYDYHFISNWVFCYRINNNFFYEWVKYGDNYYGTGRYEWNNCDCFIMETDGIKHINEGDRKQCFIIYLNIPEEIRKNRMLNRRNWPKEKIEERIKIDLEKFKDFSHYDIMITNPNF
jgi:guanylate kinase